MISVLPIPSAFKAQGRVRTTMWNSVAINVRQSLWDMQVMSTTLKKLKQGTWLRRCSLGPARASNLMARHGLPHGLPYQCTLDVNA